MPIQPQLRLDQLASTNPISDPAIYPSGHVVPAVPTTASHLFAAALESGLVVQGEVSIAAVQAVLSVVTRVCTTEATIGTDGVDTTDTTAAMAARARGGMVPHPSAGEASPGSPPACTQMSPLAVQIGQILFVDTTTRPPIRPDERTES